MEDRTNSEIQDSISTGLYLQHVAKLANKLPFDIARTVLIKTASRTCLPFAEKSGICPGCSTPESTGLTTHRLLPCKRRPRQLRATFNKNKSVLAKLTTTETTQLASHEQWSSILSARCVVCHYRTQDMCPLPIARPVRLAKVTKQAPPRPRFVLPVKKEFKRKKLKNAGLNITEELKEELKTMSKPNTKSKKKRGAETLIDSVAKSPQTDSASLSNKKNKSTKINNDTNLKSIPSCINKNHSSQIESLNCTPKLSNCSPKSNPTAKSKSSVCPGKSKSPASANKSKCLHSAAAMPLLRVSGNSNNKFGKISTSKANFLKGALNSSTSLQHPSGLSGFLNSLF